MTDGRLAELQDVSYTYPGAENPAIKEIDLEIRKGEWLAVLGANGSGKSTFAKHLNALLTPSQGDCFVNGLSTGTEEGQKEARRQVAMVFQNPENQIVAAVVEEDVAFGPENMGLPSCEIEKRVKWALGVAGLEDLARRPSYALSGGQKQRLAVAGAIAMKPPCIVLDEASSMLDPQGREELMDLLFKLRDEGLTLVTITHRLEEVERCDRCAVMENGEIMWTGSPADLFRQGEDLNHWGLEPPVMVKEWLLLREKGIVPAGTGPTERELIEALCP